MTDRTTRPCRSSSSSSPSDGEVTYTRPNVESTTTAPRSAIGRVNGRNRHAGPTPFRHDARAVEDDVGRAVSVEVADDRVGVALVDDRGRSGLHVGSSEGAHEQRIAARIGVEEQQIVGAVTVEVTGAHDGVGAVDREGPGRERVVAWPNQ